MDPYFLELFRIEKTFTASKSNQSKAQKTPKSFVSILQQEIVRLKPRHNKILANNSSLLTMSMYLAQSSESSVDSELENIV